MESQRLTRVLLEAALRGEVVLATLEGKAAADAALVLERERARETQQELGRSGDVDVIDLREDNAFMAARNRTAIHDQSLADLRRLAQAIVVGPDADPGIMPLGTEFRARIIYDYNTGITEEKMQHCRLGGPCEHGFLHTTSGAAKGVPYTSSMGRAIVRAYGTPINPKEPLIFAVPTGKARIVSLEIQP